MARVFIFVPHTGGIPDESWKELAAAAHRIDAAGQPTAVATGWGRELDAACEVLRGSFAEVWKVAHEALVYPNAEIVREALAAVLPRGAILLVPHAHFGVDLSPGLSILLDAAYVPDVTDIEDSKGTYMTLVRQEFGGEVSARVLCDISSGAVLNIRPGAFRSGETGGADGAVVDQSSLLPPLRSRRRYLETVTAEAGDVDITKQRVLVSVGRGIQEQDNIALAEELAGVLGGAVSCSRPVVDARWLEKSRQVGSSGKTVKPKVYLACGISGSFQHLAGLQGNPYIIAVNKNPKAPIFRVANTGIVDDILEFLPALTGKVREKQCVPAEGRGR